MRTGLMTSLVAVASTTTPFALADSDGGYGGHMMNGAWYMGPIMMAFFYGLLALMVVMVLRTFGIGSGATKSGATSAVQESSDAILRERFARGEIEQDEFERRKKTLNG
ncbi:SHOCT domain-containing protein [Fodinicurvata sediminis]|uniref:SHOCT domain-containing protein n=1 Tax=Fodinicurvata sediminis TaxID=1121832 RepID=UPI0003B7158F|nr:SHOCT domain-containing protein [Fodinicurvata sediminis]